MFSTPKPNEIEGWVCVYTTNTEYDAQLAKNYLGSREIESRILSKRDSAFDINVGDMALVYVYVPKNFADEAEKAMEEWEEGLSELSDEDE